MLFNARNNHENSPAGKAWRRRKVFGFSGSKSSWGLTYRWNSHMVQAYILATNIDSFNYNTYVNNEGNAWSVRCLRMFKMSRKTRQRPNFVSKRGRLFYVDETKCIRWTWWRHQLSKFLFQSVLGILFCAQSKLWIFHYFTHTVLNIALSAAGRTRYALLSKHLQWRVLYVSGGTLVNVTGSDMDSVDSPSISLTVVLTRHMNGGIVFTDSGTTNYEVCKYTWCAHSVSLFIIIEPLNDLMTAYYSEWSDYYKTTPEIIAV